MCGANRVSSLEAQMHAAARARDAFGTLATHQIVGMARPSALP